MTRAQSESGLEMALGGFLEGAVFGGSAFGPFDSFFCFLGFLASALPSGFLEKASLPLLWVFLHLLGNSAGENNHLLFRTVSSPACTHYNQELFQR